MIARLRRLPEVARALRISRELEAHEDWDAERLAVHRRERLLGIVRHAAARSPFYRERFAGVELGDDLQLTALPTLDKATMLEHFDELVTDRRLTRAGVEAHVAELERAGPSADPKLLGEYRALASGGSSGRRGVFVFGREDWVEGLLASFLRVSNAYLGLGLRLPRRRLASVIGDSPLHATGRVARSGDVGVYRTLRLDARAPLDELVGALNAFRPESLMAFASVAALLAERQLSGELQIAPQLVVTMGEVRTPEMAERILAAWGRMPFDAYGVTEAGLLAVECDRHSGMHVFEDLVQIEVVDAEYRPVPDGEPGSRVLITNLFNRTQPLIRYELNDLVTVASQPCSCGRPFRVLKSVDGRSDDILELPAAGGGTMEIHPLTLRSPLVGIAELSEYRIVYGAGKLRVAIVLNATGDPERPCREVERRLGAALIERGAQRPPIRVERVDEIPRHPQSGKHKAIEVEAA